MALFTAEADGTPIAIVPATSRVAAERIFRDERVEPLSGRRRTAALLVRSASPAEQGQWCWGVSQAVAQGDLDTAEDAADGFIIFLVPAPAPTGASRQ